MACHVIGFMNGEHQGVQGIEAQEDQYLRGHEGFRYTERDRAGKELVAYRGAERAPSGVTRSKADAKARAADVDAKAKAGEDFSALVDEYSDDPGAKDRQGSLGKFTRDKMDKAFSDAAFALRVGEVSDVVETKFGFHVIKRNQ